MRLGLVLEAVAGGCVGAAAPSATAETWDTLGAK